MISMNHREAESVCSYLRSKDIRLSPNNNWLTSCISWYKSHLDLNNVYGSLQDYVCIQWSLADLRDVQHGCLPTICMDGTTVLSGKYPIQINWVRDIGQSCYSQLQTIQNKSGRESDDTVTTEESKKQSWEPNPKRVLMMEVTDGVTTLKAMEYSPIEKLIDCVLPGVKVVLSGPIECRKGILLLKNSNVNFLGGEVDHMYEMNCKENLLPRCLNIATNVPENRNINTSVPRIVQTQNSVPAIRPQAVDRIQDVQDSTLIKQSSSTPNKDILMADEDDDFLCQLPDEVLDYGNALTSGPEKRSSTFTSFSDQQTELRGQSVENVVNNKTFTALHSKALRKPQLFPSLEDLQSVDAKTSIMSKKTPISNKGTFHSGLKQQTLYNMCYKKNDPEPTTIPTTSSKLKLTTNETNSANDSIKSSSSTNIPPTCKIIEKKNNTELTSQNEKCMISDDDSGECIIIDEEYPKIRKVVAKVETVAKLRIRNGEWLCCATICIADQLVRVTFSNKVLESLFGIPASEVEVWRDEMATNPNLKKKVNGILITGQTKLKTLNCSMTLEYSSEDCTPQVITIHNT